MKTSSIALKGIRFFYSHKKKDQLVGSVMIQGKDLIILIPKKFENSVKAHIPYDLIVEPIKNGQGYYVVSFERSEVTVEFRLSVNKDEVYVYIMGKFSPKYSYTNDLPSSPYDFYTKMVSAFLKDVPSTESALDFKLHLQQISSYYNRPWGNEKEEEIPVEKSIEELTAQEKNKIANW